MRLTQRTAGTFALPHASAFLSLSIALALWLMLAEGAFAQQRVTLDEAAIIVNNKIMTRREVTALRDLQIKEAQSRYKGEDLQLAIKNVNENIVNSLVETLLIEARADEEGITVSDKEIDQRMEAIVRRDPGVMDIYSEEQLKNFIYKDSLRRQVLQKDVNTRVRVEDEEVKRACRAESRDTKEVDVGHILIRGHDVSSLEEIRKIQGMLLAGADFEETATKYSQDPSAATNHGRLGFVSRGQFVKEFEDKAFSMPVGPVSDPVATQFGYHLIRVFAERNKQAVDCEHLDDANRSRIFNRLFAQASEARMKEFLAQLRKRADIVVRVQ
jgi:parvulin-like peptidyl-prolyl isomerase